MPTNIATTKKMLIYAENHLGCTRGTIAVPKVSTLVPVWGTGKRTLAWRVSGHMHKHGKPVLQSTQKTKELVAQLFPNLLPPLHIIHPDYKWNGAPVARRGGPPGTVWHHAAGFGSPEEIHAYHVKIGDRGIAYTLYIRRDGKVYAGRPENTMGAHCLGHNDCIGVCLEGNYEAHDDMPTAQLKAAQAVHRYLNKKYGRPDWQHKNMSGNSTACPGKFYHFGKITQ